jgi:hypothetical protein
MLYILVSARFEAPQERRPAEGTKPRHCFITGSFIQSRGEQSILKFIVRILGMPSTSSSDSSGWGMFSNFVSSEAMKGFVGDGTPQSSGPSSLKPPTGMTRPSSAGAPPPLQGQGQGHRSVQGQDNTQSKRLLPCYVKCMISLLYVYSILNF